MRIFSDTAKTIQPLPFWLFLRSPGWGKDFLPSLWDANETPSFLGGNSWWNSVKWNLHFLTPLCGFGTDCPAGWRKKHQSLYLGLREILILSLTMGLRIFAKPVTGLCISRGKTLAGGCRWFLSGTDLNKMLLEMRKWIQIFSRVVIFIMLDFGFGLPFITRTMWLILFSFFA